MSEYPEHDRMKLVVWRTQAVGDFLEWVAEKYDARLMRYVDNEDVTGWLGVGRSTLELLAEWTDIDLTKIETEKRAMLERIRALNEHGGQTRGTQDLADESDRSSAGSGASEEDATPPPG